jgi:hypothetical protein
VQEWGRTALLCSPCLVRRRLRVRHGQPADCIHPRAHCPEIEPRLYRLRLYLRPKGVWWMTSRLVWTVSYFGHGSQRLHQNISYRWQV